MLEKRLIDEEELLDLKQAITDRMPEWLATLERYNDLSIEDVW